MALKPCRECKKKVSTEAVTCPNCGAPHPTAKAIKKIEPEFQYKFGDVKIENKELKIIKVNQKDTYARCEKSFCSKRYEVTTIVKSKLGKEMCNGCGNPLVKVTERQAKKYFDDKSNINNKDVHIPNNQINLRGRFFFNGTKSLAETFWLYFIGGNFLINICLSLIINSNNIINLKIPLFFIMILSLCWNFLCILGIFNSANKYKISKIKNKETYGYATAAKIISILLVLSGLGRIISDFKYLIIL